MSSEEEVVNLEDLTKAELQDVADEKGIDWSDSDTKAELIDAIHAADVEAGDVPTEAEADAATAPEDQLAYGSEAYPERRPVEVDLADVDPGDGEGEFAAPLNAESWVILDGSHDGVPDRFDGAIAAVLDWPSVTVTNPDTGEQHEEFPVDGTLIVQERSQGLRLSLPMEAFKEVHTNGRPSVLGYA